MYIRDSVSTDRILLKSKIDLSIKTYTMSRITRKKFITDVGLSTLALPLLSSFSNCNNPSEEKSQNHIMTQKQKGKLGIALVGLGNYATNQLAPALQQTEHC